MADIIEIMAIFGASKTKISFPSPTTIIATVRKTKCPAVQMSCITADLVFRAAIKSAKEIMANINTINDLESEREIDGVISVNTDSDDISILKIGTLYLLAIRNSRST